MTYLQGVLDSFTSYKQKKDVCKKSFLADLLRLDFSKEESELIFTTIEEVLQRIEQKRNFSSVFIDEHIKPDNVPQIGHIFEQEG